MAGLLCKWADNDNDDADNKEDNKIDNNKDNTKDNNNKKDNHKDRHKDNHENQNCIGCVDKMQSFCSSFGATLNPMQVLNDGDSLFSQLWSQLGRVGAPSDPSRPQQTPPDPRPPGSESVWVGRPDLADTTWLPL